MLKSILMVKNKRHSRGPRVIWNNLILADPAQSHKHFIGVPFLNEHFILDAVVDSKASLYAKRRINLNQQTSWIRGYKNLLNVKT